MSTRFFPLFLSLFFFLSGVPARAATAYRPPDLEKEIFDTKKIKLEKFDRTDAVGGLVAVARDFDDEDKVDYELRAHALAIAHRLDKDNDRVQVLRMSDGTFLRQIGGARGSRNGQFNFPLDVALSPDETELLVLDLGNLGLHIGLGRWAHDHDLDVIGLTRLFRAFLYSGPERIARTGALHVQQIRLRTGKRGKCETTDGRTDQD